MSFVPTASCAHDLDVEGRERYVCRPSAFNSSLAPGSRTPLSLRSALCRLPAPHLFLGPRPPLVFRLSLWFRSSLAIRLSLVLRSSLALRFKLVHCLPTWSPIGTWPCPPQRRYSSCTLCSPLLYSPASQPSSLAHHSAFACPSASARSCSFRHRLTCCHYLVFARNLVAASSS